MEMSLKNKIKKWIFYPEVYVYPTPRSYKPLQNLNLADVDFGNKINLYIHIPFCQQMCAYCGYLKIIDSSKEITNQYVNAVVKEIIGMAPYMKDKTVNTLHFGGGTPALLTHDQIKIIMGTIKKISPDIKNVAREISIESTPDLITEKSISDYLDLGFNRISCGIQSLIESELSLALRRHTINDVEKSLKILRYFRVPNVVFDLMIGIAGQTVQSFKKSVLKIIELQPDTVELYALGAMPFTKWCSYTQTFMPTKDLYHCYELGMELFLENGYRQDCHNRYVLPGSGGFLQEDNIFKGEALIGFGAGARTYAQNFHYRNCFSPDKHRDAILRYMEKIEGGKSPIESGCAISREEKIRQYAIYNIEHLDTPDFKKRFVTSFESFFGSILSDLCKLSLGSISGKIFTLNKKGLLFRDLIVHELYSSTIRALEEKYRPIL